MVETFESLLRQYLAIPKTNQNPTFMDICHMGGDRFEERCSQIFRFFLSPEAPHNMRGLFLNSLLSLLHCDDYSYTSKSVNVITEEMTEDRKRIDITVIADDFVIAIENKIWASLYNELDKYKAHVETTYPGKKLLLVVLSVKNITDPEELKKIKINGYVYVNYRDYFDEIKRNIGLYAMNADSTYMTFLFDFIRTIENRYYFANMELKNFFADHKQDIESLISEYNKYNDDILRQQIDRISEIKRLVSESTHANWWVWQGWDLGISFNDNSNKIGIECSFDADKLSPTASFYIYITVWNRNCFAPYEAALKEKYPHCEIDKHPSNNRIYLHLPVINGEDEEQIISKLTEYYNDLKQITDVIK